MRVKDNENGDEDGRVKDSENGDEDGRVKDSENGDEDGRVEDSENGDKDGRVEDQEQEKREWTTPAGSLLQREKHTHYRRTAGGLLHIRAHGHLCTIKAP